MQQVEATGQVSVEIRFAHFIARGVCDGNCPRCGRRAVPSHWELEGPESRANTMWFSCSDAEHCHGDSQSPPTWTQAVLFARGWEDR